MVLPEIHPGPYHPVGGSNIPYLIYKNLSSSAMIMHSISDHALNTSADKLSKWFMEIAENAQSNITSAKYEILENETEVKVMGQSIYEDYSKALDNSLKITKIFVIGCIGLFITSLFL
jgi:predicted neutral ceramidase superfamily lipid hydrolase